MARLAYLHHPRRTVQLGGGCVMHEAQRALSGLRIQTLESVVLCHPPSHSSSREETPELWTCLNRKKEKQGNGEE